MALKAALARAAGYIAPNQFETAEPRTRVECGAPLESWQASRCQACIDKSLTSVVVANSAQWQTEDDAQSDEKIAVIEGILGDTQHKRSRPNSVYFLEASDLCWMGK